MLVAGLSVSLAPAAVAAPPPVPHVEDPAGDADALDGMAGAASQARFDLRAVTLKTTRKASSFSVTFTMQGTTTIDAAGLFLVGDVETCGELRVWVTLDAATAKPAAKAAWDCDRLPGQPSGAVNLSAPSVRGKTVTVSVPLSRLHKAMRAGSRYAKFVAGTYVADPLDTRVPEAAPIDDARGTRGYHLAG